MPRTPALPRLYVNNVEVLPTDYVTLDNGIVLVTVRTVDGRPTLRGRGSKAPYWFDVNTLQIEKSEITAVYPQ